MIILFNKCKNTTFGQNNIMKLLQMLISTRAMAILLFLFAIAIGVATFVENSYDTITARLVIYNAKYFELILVLLAIVFLYNIKRYKLLSLKKITLFVFHIGFVIVLIGAGITRYIGYEGVMLIPEKSSVDYIYSSKAHLQFNVIDLDDSIEYSYNPEHYFTDLLSKYFIHEFYFPKNGNVSIEYKDFIKHAKESIVKDTVYGTSILEIVLPSKENLILESGDIINKGGINISLNNNTNIDGLKFYTENNQIKVYSSYDFYSIDMASLTVADRQKSFDSIPKDALKKDTLYNIKTRSLLNVNDYQIMIKAIHNNSRLSLEQSDQVNLPDALRIKVKVEDEEKEVIVYGGARLRPMPSRVELGGLYFNLAYGTLPIKLPFRVGLTDFRLVKYPGSDSPSSYESDIKIIDSTNNVNEDYNIFMNNVVDYNGYRFFQSSYDWSSEELKESGANPDITILSVNHDFWGTWISYLGYILLLLGFISTMLNPNSRFIKLRKSIKKIRKQRNTIGLLLLFMLSGSISQAQNYKPVNINDAEKLGFLLVQSVEGRIQPIHTLAYDLFHKISKTDKFNLQDGSNVDAMQLFIDFMIDPKFCSKEKIIYIRPSTGVSDSLGISGKYASVLDFFDTLENEKLLKQVNLSFSKKDIDKNVFDKEVIKVYERFNLLSQVISSDILRIFPLFNDENNTWVSWRHESAKTSISHNDSHLKNISLSNILASYLDEVKAAKHTGDFSKATELLNILSSFQELKANKSLLPSEALIKTEIYYNKANIFKNLKNIYGLLAILLLVLSFITTLSSNKKTVLNKIFKILLWLCIICLGMSFVYHTYALYLRWYITGHAPWSNGYEALTFIAWGGIFAGFVFVRNSKITLAATCLLAFFTLMTAGHSSYDPQLTNLQPVLKSTWLIIHVACITISYGFLGLGFILGLINLFTYLGLTNSNKNRLKLVIKELTYINEITLTIGLMLATIGTFLGGVWASESWGRYWGWDAKETWALVIVLVYAAILHFRIIPKMQSKFTFNVASVLAFSTVLMTFVGVNYYLSKGLHSYARGETPAFPLWAWITIFLVFVLIFGAKYKNKKFLM